MRPAYTYEARVLDILDGDTINVDINLGCYVWIHKQKIRLAGLNDPVEKVAGQNIVSDAKRYLQEVLTPITKVVIQTEKTSKEEDKKEKFGRWLGVVWYLRGSEWINLNKELLDKGFVKEYHGERR